MLKILAIALIAFITPTQSISRAQEMAPEKIPDGYHLRAETVFTRTSEGKPQTLKQNSEVVIKNSSSWVSVPNSGDNSLQLLTRVSKANRETADVEYIVTRPTQNELPVVSTGRMIVRWNEPATLHEVSEDKDLSIKVTLRKTDLPKP